MPDDGKQRVGYGHPPVHSRFKKGVSGNPKGRRKGTKNLRTDLAEELAEVVRVREGDREYGVSKQRAVLKALVAAAVRGDMRAASSIITLCARLFGVAEQEEPEVHISPSDERILQDFINGQIERRNKASSGGEEK